MFVYWSKGELVFRESRQKSPDIMEVIKYYHYYYCILILYSSLRCTRRVHNTVVSVYVLARKGVTTRAQVDGAVTGGRLTAVARSPASTTAAALRFAFRFARRITQQPQKKKPIVSEPAQTDRWRSFWFPHRHRHTRIFTGHFAATQSFWFLVFGFRLFGFS